MSQRGRKEIQKWEVHRGLNKEIQQRPAQGGPLPGLLLFCDELCHFDYHFVHRRSGNNDV
jgi:hypothetical protein